LEGKEKRDNKEMAHLERELYKEQLHRMKFANRLNNVVGHSANKLTKRVIGNYVMIEDKFV